MSAIYVTPSRFKQLGALPVVIGIAAGLEAAWAWYDPDVFMDMWLEADQEQQVENLNNWWVDVERTARATIPSNSDAMRALDGTIAKWNAWKAQYHDAVLRRWIPFVGRDWDAELLQWFKTLKDQSEKVHREGGAEAKRRLEAAGFDPDRLPEPDQGLIEQAKEVIDEAASGAGRAAQTGLFWPALAVGASAGMLILIASRSPKKRVSTG